MWFPNRFNTNRAAQAQKVARGWKFWIQKVEELYYPCSENKGSDQLRSNCEADLRLCFRLFRLLVFPCSGSFIKVIDTIPVMNLVINTIKCCIKSVIDTFYSPSLSYILLRS